MPTPSRAPDAADRLWWAGGVVLAVVGVAVAAAFSPVPGDPHHLDLFGARFGPTCTFLLATGLPCPSCGMTRAWVSAVHGDLPAALRFNVAGTLLLAGVVFNALTSTWQLLGGRLPAWRHRATLAVMIAWLVVFFASWALRIVGFNPLP